eukprot:TRINITY_DN906_c0_g1_i1.p1 TRINITY_DN906_c0_g1~~TRINITY_DN906_c0_g1_i1.p1  ORF type:complete len:419 (+),score=58.63 TRINITY_DN906_c0_g1_i1:115-1371(+)
MKVPRLDALDATRWVASVQIVLSHIYPELGKWAEQGKLFTQMFFLLSGFVLAFAEMTRQQSSAVRHLGVLKYHFKRLTTLYPAYAFAMCAQFWLHWNSSSYPPMSWFQGLMFPVSLLLGQSVVVMCHPEFPRVYQTSCFAWNSPTWFISALTVYWMTLRPMATFFRDMSLRNCLLWWIVLWCSSILPEIVALVFAIQNNGNPWVDCRVYSLTHGCLGYFHVFFAGIVLARIFILTCCKDCDTNGPLTAITRTLVVAPDKANVVFRYGCVIGYTLYYYVVWQSRFPLDTAIFFLLHNGGLLPLFALIIVGSSLGVDPIAMHIFKTPVMSLLGRISVYQYLLQYVVKDYLTARFPGLGIPWTFGLKVLYPFVLVGCAVLLEEFVQKPLQKFWEFYVCDVKTQKPVVTERSSLVEDGSLKA